MKTAAPAAANPRPEVQRAPHVLPVVSPVRGAPPGGAGRRLRVGTGCRPCAGPRAAPGAARAPRRVGGPGGGHRLAVAPRPPRRQPARGADRAAGPRGGAAAERGDLPGSSRRGRALPVGAGAVVGVPNRRTGEGAGAALGPAGDGGGGGTPAGDGAARVVQSLPRPASLGEERRGPDAPEPDEPRAGEELRPLPVDGPGGAGGAGALAAGDARRGAALRRGWRAHRRLLLPVPGAGLR